MKLLILGATGGTGHSLVKQALARGDHVTALLLKGTEVAVRHPRLDCVAGDARDTDLVVRLARGREAVLSALGAHGLGPTTVCRDATRSVVRAMGKAGVRRLVCVTSAGLTERTGIIYGRLVTPLFLRNIYLDKRWQEEEIVRSGLDWTLVRPMRLIDGPRTGACRAIEDGPVPGWWVTREDLAAFMLREVGRVDFVRRSPILVEPLTLRAISMLLGAPSFGDLSGARLRKGA
jgi:putative NADH-flavin reductase